MDEEQKLIQDCYMCLHLDERASQREVELAYETLTKNSDKKNYSKYRQAFETLMCKVYNVLNTPNDIQNDKQQNTPNNSQVGITNSEVNGVPVNYVNITLFCENLYKNYKSFFGKEYWTKDNIECILKQSCINNIKYATLSIDMSSSYSSVKRVIQEFMSNLEELYCQNKLLCTKFEVKNTYLGAMAYGILEKNLATHIKELVELKGQEIDCAYYTQIEKEI